jgi:rhodanese-related sulfurtransferase
VPDRSCAGVHRPYFVRMCHRTLACLCWLALGNTLAAAQAHYENDNVRFTTLGWRDLPKELKDHPDALVLDVRSPGEFSDTSRYSGLNIGRLRGAVNISIDSIAANYQRLVPYRDKQIYVYCSHSQRSRRVCTQLADSGFTKLINLNGGLSRYRSDHSTLTALDPLVESANHYDFADPGELCAFAAKGAFLVDVRTDSLYDPALMNEHARAMGHIKKAVHFTKDHLVDHLSELPHDRPIVLIDAFGDDAYAAAGILYKHGFTRLYVLFDGLDDLLYTPAAEFACAPDLMERSLPYRVITPEELDPKALASGAYRVIDVRTAEEFDGRAKMVWQNIGKLRGAMNVPAATLTDSKQDIGVPKDVPLLVVGRANNDELYASARALCDRGYTKVTVLAGGIWHLRWTAHNVAGMEALESVVEPPKTERAP